MKNMLKLFPCADLDGCSLFHGTERIHSENQRRL